jgi:hypothetical protein
MAMISQELRVRGAGHRRVEHVVDHQRTIDAHASFGSF